MGEFLYQDGVFVLKINNKKNDACWWAGIAFFFYDVLDWLENLDVGDFFLVIRSNSEHLGLSANLTCGVLFRICS